MMSPAEVDEAVDQDRFGEEIEVACDGCGMAEPVFFDRRSGRPWSGVEPCECGAGPERRRAAEDGWEYR